MVKHNHRWKDIKTYTLSELGVFVREAAEEEQATFRTNLLVAWLGTNGDPKHVQSLLGMSGRGNVSASSRKGNGQDVAFVKGEWQRAALALSKLR